MLNFLNECKQSNLSPKKRIYRVKGTNSLKNWGFFPEKT
ncbi:hypothetical protein C789_4040 [Microcystis aeruginosa FACHB-905 = DIANCHI905]|uniref:Uncharacterized protein n=1 Tax=Microcystis aeruginosa PCC 7806SL TaxID=1903187 RepID=A0AB33BZP4_MICA7|nr:hypothetical protein BH695_2852 [Microcystis aeruginosa PCC 7806SL]ELS46154.1 hypothetical protein C789_4040 [Microcystis aeruginosa FACHB-905 = DIANCHI905]